MKKTGFIVRTLYTVACRRYWSGSFGCIMGVKGYWAYKYTLYRRRKGIERSVGRVENRTKHRRNYLRHGPGTRRDDENPANEIFAVRDERKPLENRHYRVSRDFFPKGTVHRHTPRIEWLLFLFRVRHGLPANRIFKIKIYRRCSNDLADIINAPDAAWGRRRRR